MAFDLVALITALLSALLSPPSPPSPPFSASDHAHDGKAHLLLAATGSVASIKIPFILHALSPHHAHLSIRLVLTTSALPFLAPSPSASPAAITAHLLATHHPLLAAVHLDADEWAHAWTPGAPILHIELRRWADALLVAPLSANTLAKIVGGLADNLLTAVVRAWDTRGAIDTARGGGASGAPKRIVVAPAMNTAMWEHPVTAGQVRMLEREWSAWFEVLRPVEKTLACGDVGGGAMCEWREIVRVVEERLGLGDPL